MQMTVPYVTLATISDKIDYGLTASATNDNTGIKFLRITDIQDGFVQWESVPYCKCSKRDLQQYSLIAGDILFARTGATTGKSFLVKQCPPNTVFASYLIRVKSNLKVIHPQYLSYFFQTSMYWQQITESAVGAAQPGVNATKLSQVIIPCPPLSEQKRIAAILEKADRLRRLQRYALELSGPYLQSVFLEMFGSWDYPLYPLQELSKKERGAFVNGPFGSNLLTSELTSSGVPVIYIRDIASGVYERVSSVCVTQQKAEELNVCKVLPGDILVAKVGDPPGTAAIYPGSQPMGIITQDVIRICVNRSLVTPEYLSTFFNSRKGYHTLEPIIVEGTRTRFGLTPYTRQVLNSVYLHSCTSVNPTKRFCQYYALL